MNIQPDDAPAPRTKADEKTIASFVDYIESSLASTNPLSIFDWPHYGEPKESLDALINAVRKEFKLKSEIYCMGSARFGLSSKPTQLFCEYDPNSSDIDLVTIDREFFDAIWFAISNGRNDYYWDNDRFFSFQKYLLQGWIRMDFLPPDFAIGRTIWTTLSEIKKKHECPKISLAIFADERFFTKYLKRSLNAALTEHRLQTT